MRKLFGTDGIRGIANREPLTPELVLRLGQVVAQHFGRSGARSRVVIGRDTRRSGDMLESALVAGICSAGGDALLAGVLPTPAIALLVRSLQAAAGLVVSASHNPFADNGIKVFGGDGFKLPDAVEQQLESALALDAMERPSGADVGVATTVERAVDRYVEHLREAVKVDLGGFGIVVDCANGAASLAGPRLFDRCGARVETLHASPDGTNINHLCGAMHPKHLQEVVRVRGADLGVALDGDADRVLLVDETGALVDGDEILAILAQDAQRRGVGGEAGVVATVMSNLGLEHALRDLGIKLDRCAVGDRYVVEAMRRSGARMGGEPSGHIVLLDHATTGDGLLAALSVAAVMIEHGKPLSALRTVMRHCPQALINVPVRQRRDLESIATVQEALRRAQKALATDGRVLLRYSGTEPLVRVMVEGVDAALVEAHARDIADAVRASSIGEKAG